MFSLQANLFRGNIKETTRNRLPCFSQSVHLACFSLGLSGRSHAHLSLLPWFCADACFRCVEGTTGLKSGEERCRRDDEIPLLLSVFVRVNKFPPFCRCIAVVPLHSRSVTKRIRTSSVYFKCCTNVCFTFSGFLGLHTMCTQSFFIIIILPYKDTVNCVFAGGVTSRQTLKGIWGKCTCFWKVKCSVSDIWLHFSPALFFTSNRLIDFWKSCWSPCLKAGEDWSWSEHFVVIFLLETFKDKFIALHQLSSTKNKASFFAALYFIMFLVTWTLSNLELEMPLIQSNGCPYILSLSPLCPWYYFCVKFISSIWPKLVDLHGSISFSKQHKDVDQSHLEKIYITQGLWH